MLRAAIPTAPCPILCHGVLLAFKRAGRRRRAHYFALDAAKALVKR